MTAPAAVAPRLRAAAEPPEERGRGRDDVRLVVGDGRGARVHDFAELPDLLAPGDLLVANRSGVLPASLPARGAGGAFVLNLAGRFGLTLWLAEPRVDAATPGPLRSGDRIDVAGALARVLGAYPGLPRLRFVRLPWARERDPYEAGVPIQYGHLARTLPLAAFSTIFADRPGSAEMASAGRPFTRALLAELRARGIEVARITLHAGVSSQEVPAGSTDLPVPPEPFEVDRDTAARVNAALAAGRRVVAIGTGAVRALETAWDGRAVRAVHGWTGRVLRPGTSGGFLAGVVSGLHEPEASHRALLHAVVGASAVARAEARAQEEELQSHEFGDLQLLWRDGRAV